MSSVCHFAEEAPRFLFGELDERAAAEFQRHLSECAECRREIESLKASLAVLALSAPPAQLPPGARQRVLSAIAREPKFAPMPELVSIARHSRVFGIRNTWLPWAPGLVAVALLLVTLVLWRNDRNLEQQLQTVRAEVGQQEADAQKTREVVSAFTEPDAIHVTLVPSGSAPQPHGRAVYVRRKGVLVFLASNLNQLPPKKSYQLWVIPAAGGPPIPAGRFKPDQRGTAMVMSRHRLPNETQLKTFAVTVEPDEGASTPTQPPVLVGDAGD